MKKIKKWAVALAIIVPARLAAETGLPALNMAVGAHGQSMAGAYAAHVRDASAAFWNPSALPDLAGRQIFFYANQSLFDYRYNYLSFASPSFDNRRAIAVSIAQLNKGEFEGRDETGARSGDFRAADYVGALSYGWRLSPAISAGTTLKIIRSEIGSFSATGGALDLAGTYRLPTATRLSLGVQNIGPSVRYESDSFRLPTLLSVAAAHPIKNALTIAAAVRYDVNERTAAGSFGAEYSVGNLISLRTGYLLRPAAGIVSEKSSDSNSITGLSAGVGLRLLAGTSLDYAFVPQGELGDSHHLNLIWRLDR